MSLIIGGPKRYIQGQNELQHLGEYCKTLGNKALVLIDENIQNIVMPFVRVDEIEYIVMPFSGECCLSNVQMMIKKRDHHGCDVIVGIGGGKILDIAKAVSYYSNCRMVIVPTVASTDAPCSSIAVLYHEDGSLDAYLHLKNSPDMVLVDSLLISNAPKRLLAAGMGDALSTYFETRACYRSGITNDKRILELSKLCFDTVLKFGVSAYNDVGCKQCTQAVEKIIEANIYLSGIGFELGGLACAHAIGYGLSKHTKQCLHGEVVAFGTLVQLVLEKVDNNEIMNIMTLCKEIGLPTTLEELGIQENAVVKMVANDSCSYESMTNMPFAVVVDDVYQAIMKVNELSVLCRSNCD